MLYMPRRVRHTRNPMVPIRTLANTQAERLGCSNIPCDGRVHQSLHKGRMLQSKCPCRVHCPPTMNTTMKSLHNRSLDRTDPHGRSITETIHSHWSYTFLSPAKQVRHFRPEQIEVIVDRCPDPHPTQPLTPRRQVHCRQACNSPLVWRLHACKLQRHRS